MGGTRWTTLVRTMDLLFISSIHFPLAAEIAGVCHNKTARGLALAQSDA